MTEDEMVRWHQRRDGHEFEQTSGAGDGQGSLVCCSPWGGRVQHNLVTEQQQQYNYYLCAFLFEIRQTLKKKKKVWFASLS